jgi:hypothetical protein
VVGLEPPPPNEISFDREMLLHPLALGQHSVRAKQVINSIATPSSLVRMIAYNKLNEFLIIYNNSKYYIS